MAVDKNNLEINGKNVNLLSKNTYNIQEICGYCGLSPTILPGQRDRVQLQGRMR